MRIAWTSLLLAACTTASTTTAQPSTAGGKGDGFDDRQALARCTGHDFTPDAAGRWSHFSSSLIALGEPAHSADDVVALGGRAVTATARFEYGPLFKDLERERVNVYVDTCDGWRFDGVETTDDDGRIQHTFAALPYGVYDVRFEVVGDASLAPARLWLLPPGTHLVVYDIDGTLTTSDLEEIQQVLADLFDGDYVPGAYPAAAELTQAYAQTGTVGLYLTGRPHSLMAQTRAWLDDEGFAPGAVRLAATTIDALPTESGVGAFKLRVLRDLVAQGFVLDAAHGNATTDISAYLGAGLAPGSIWIIGPHAGEQDTIGVTGSWADHAAEVAGSSAVSQPFAP